MPSDFASTSCACSGWHSFACLKEIAGAGLPIDFDFHQDGTLQLFRDEAGLKAVPGITRALDEFEVPWRFLEGADAASVEPALAHARVHRGRAVPAGGRLRRQLQVRHRDERLPARSGRGLPLWGPDPAPGRAGGRIAGVETDQGTLTADAYVVALGGQSPFLLRPLGMTLPIYPLKGYSITADVTDAGRAPRAIMDEHNKVMISRLGSRIRAAGMAE